MSSTRYPLLMNGDAQSYPMRRNAIFLAFESEMRQMFNRYEGIPRTQDQKEWYVFDRWNVQNDQIVRAPETPEERLLKFIKEPVGTGNRQVRLIYGRTGCGKSTFVNHFFSSYLPERHPDFYDSLFWFRIDIHNAAIEVGDLEEDIDHQLDQKLNQEYKWLDESPHYMDMWTAEINWDTDFYRDLWRDLSQKEIEKEKLAWIEGRRREPRPGRSNDNAYSDFNRVRLNYLASKFGRSVIVVWDNIDHARLDVQRAAISLAQHKLTWIPNLKIIITVREYTRTRVETELTPTAFQVSDQPLAPPPIHLVLQKRAQSAFRALRSRDTDNVSVTVDTGSVSVTVQDGVKFLQSVLFSFKEVENNRILTRLSNYNLRTQLDMVGQVLRSGHTAPRSDVLDALQRHYTSPQDPWRIRWANLLEAMICGDFRFRHSQESRVVNIYDAGSPTGYYNTLNIPYVMQIVQQWPGGSISPEKLGALLEKLGHPNGLTINSIEQLLNRGLIESPQGKSLHEDKIQQLKLSDAGMYYLADLMLKLMYLQHMGLTTPLKSKFRVLLSLWTPGDFKCRIQGAKALYFQIKEDEDSQSAYARRNAPEAVAIMDQYHLGRLSEELRKGLLDELRAIRRDISPSFDWDEIMDGLI